MTWSEEVSLVFLEVLKDPEIIRYLLSIAKPIHNNFIFEEARLFHESLRVTRLDRWNKTKELSRLRKFNQMNSLVPVTTTLPFDNNMWKNSCELLQSIRYLQYGFIRKKYPIREYEGRTICEDIDLELPLKIKCINLIFDDDIKGGDFRGYLSRAEIREHLDDFEIYEDWDNSIEGEETPPHETPYLLIEIWCDGILRSGYSKRIFNFRDDTDLYIQELMN